MANNNEKKVNKKFKPDELGRYSPDRLTYAPWNPKQRIDATDKKFLQLVDSIRTYGQFMPALINPYGLVIDGNRRVAACRNLGIPVECVVRDNADAFRIYDVVNNCRYDIKGAQLAEIFLKEKRALSKNQLTKMERLSDSFGGPERLNELFALEFPTVSLFGAEIIRSFCRKNIGRIPGPEDTWSLVKWMRIAGFTTTHLTKLRSWLYIDYDGNASGWPKGSIIGQYRNEFQKTIWEEWISKEFALPIKGVPSCNSEGNFINALLAVWVVKFSPIESRSSLTEDLIEKYDPNKPYRTYRDDPFRKQVIAFLRSERVFS